MTAITLATFRSRIRTLGDYLSSAKFTDAFVNECVNDAIGEYCDLLDSVWEGYRDTVGTVVTVAGTATVALPSNFLKARAIDLLDAGRYVALTRLQMRETYGYDATTGKPVGYIVRGNLAELFPTPNAVYTIRLRYVPAASVLADDADSIDIPNGWETFIVHTAILRLDQREQRPIGERLAVIDRVRQRIIGAASQRNVAGPELLRLPGVFLDLDAEDFL